MRWNDRLLLVTILGTFVFPLGAAGCWHERREPAVYVEPRHDDHRDHHEEIRHDEHHD